jgi:hypothetical protein
VQPPPESSPLTARFSVALTDPNLDDDVEYPLKDFTFTAEVTDAESYGLDFGDGSDPLTNIVPDPDDTVTLRHVYNSPGDYDAVMTARRVNGDSVASTLLVAIQFPPVVPKSTNLPWILLMIVLLLIILWLVWKLASTLSTGGVTFEPTIDRGRVRMVGSTTLDDAVSLRVHRDEGHVSISTDNGEQQ